MLEEIHYLDRNDFAFGIFYEKVIAFLLNDNLPKLLSTEDVNDIVNIYNSFTKSYTN